MKKRFHHNFQNDSDEGFWIVFLIVVVMLILAMSFGCGKTVEPTMTSERVQTPQFGEEVVGPATSFEQAMELAQRHNRSVLLIFSSTWCDPCKIMENEVWSSPTVQRKLKKFIVYKVDVDRQRSLANKFGVRTVPTYIILDEDAKPVRIGSGQRNHSEIMRWLD